MKKVLYLICALFVAVAFGSVAFAAHHEKKMAPTDNAVKAAPMDNAVKAAPTDNTAKMPEKK